MWKRFRRMRVYVVLLLILTTFVAVSWIVVSIFLDVMVSDGGARVKPAWPMAIEQRRVLEGTGYLAPESQLIRDSPHLHSQISINQMFDHSDDSITSGHHQQQRRAPPVVLFWNYMPGNEDYGIGYGVNFTKRFCNVTCEFTSDRSRFSKSSAIIVHAYSGSSIDRIDPLPGREPWQRVVFYLRESPVHTKSMRSFANGVNWTMSYRRDSDIFTPYGAMAVATEDRAVRKNFAARKKKLAMWLVSNCNTNSRRENYMRRLKRYMRVDVFGHCATQKCNDSCPSLAREYKFYMALENSFCEDYVTEKSWRTLKWGIVPVVLGSADYSSILPPGSFINAADFKSPRYLAKYLKEVDADDNLYNKFFEWKKHYVLAPNPRTPSFCALCTRLVNNATEPRTFYSDIDHWWRTGKCEDVSERFPALSKFFL